MIKTLKIKILFLKNVLSSETINFQYASCKIMLSDVSEFEDTP